MTSARRSLVIVAITLSFAACDETPRTIPSSPASIAGQITALDRDGERIGTARVETQPSDSTGSPKAVVRISQRTIVTTPSLASAGYNDLKVGQRVRVWFIGPIRESYPVQADAGTVVIER